MNKRQVFLLWVIAIALGAAIAYLKFGRKQAVAEHTARLPGQTLFEAFPAAQIAAIEVRGVGDKVVNLAKKDGKWTVAERDGYPANTSTVNGLLRTIEELKVTQGTQAGPSFLPRFGLDETATTLEKRGYTLTFKDAAGKDLAKVSLDQRKDEEGNPMSPFGGGGPSGRFVRNHADETGVYRVGETFSTVSEDPKRWLAEDFVQVEKIKAISVTQPDKPDLAWKLTRDTEEGAFVLDGAAATEKLDTTATDPLKTLFSYSRIDDVIPAAKLAERVQTEGKRTATLETFEGFTYTITFTPLKPSAAPPPAADPNNPAPPPAETFAVTVDVKAELPKERKKEADEKPEDAKAKDTAFDERKKTLSERLAKEQALAGRTFELAKYTLEALLKDRAALIKKEETPAPGATPAPTPAPATTGPIEAVTPPIAVPPLPEPGAAQPAAPEGQPATEAKPTEEKPAEEKPAEPAKDGTETKAEDKPDGAAAAPPTPEESPADKPGTEEKSADKVEEKPADPPQEESPPAPAGGEPASPAEPASAPENAGGN